MSDWKEIRKRKLEENLTEPTTSSKFSKLDPDVIELSDDDTPKEKILDTIELLSDEDTNKQQTPKPTCPYGLSCYRKNPIHLKEFSHPISLETTVDQDSKSLFKFTSINRLNNNANSVSLRSKIVK